MPRPDWPLHQLIAVGLLHAKELRLLLFASLRMPFVSFMMPGPCVACITNISCTSGRAEGVPVQKAHRSAITRPQSCVKAGTRQKPKVTDSGLSIREEIVCVGGGLRVCEREGGGERVSTRARPPILQLQVLIRFSQDTDNALLATHQETLRKAGSKMKFAASTTVSCERKCS